MLGENHTIWKQSNEFTQELNLQDQMKQSLVHYRQKKSKEKLSKSNSNRYKKPGKISLCMADTHNKVSKQMLIKQTHICGFVVWAWILKQGFIMTAQHQSLYTRNYQARITKSGVDPKCRICDQYEETLNHLVSGCPGIHPTTT